MNLYVNKIGPYHNPSETYPFYHYGFCRVREESDFREKWSGFGEIFQGNHLINSDYTAKFAIDTPKTWLCNEENIGPGSSYWIVIRDEYYYEMIIGTLQTYCGTQVRTQQRESLSVLMNATVSFSRRSRALPSQHAFMHVCVVCVHVFIEYLSFSQSTVLDSRMHARIFVCVCLF